MLARGSANIIAPTPYALPDARVHRVESTLNEPFSEHLRDRKSLDSYVPSDHGDPLPFALHLRRSNLEYRAAMRLSHAAASGVSITSATLPASKVNEAGASPLALDFKPRLSTPAISTPLQPLIVERVRLAYRVLPPTVRGAVLDVSA